MLSFIIAAFGQSSTNPFGQTSFGTPQGFDQSSTAANNPFAPKPFGSPTTTFGAQTGSSLFATTSTGAFGQQQSTPGFGTTSTGAFGQQQSTPTFGTPSSSPFGSSTPAFGASPTPAFGATSSGMYYAFPIAFLFCWFAMLIILDCQTKPLSRLSNE
jgi:nuclear pore complex protein Nup98-Nup96